MDAADVTGKVGGGARQLMEERYGKLGTGVKGLVIGGRAYSLDELLHALGLGFEDIRPIDAHDLGGGTYAVRYYDGEERRIVAYEFDAALRYMGETRAHIAEWLGDDEYYNFGWSAWCPWSL